MRPTCDDSSADDARPSERESIAASAAAWLAERDAGLSPLDEKKFAAWRAADPRHEAAVARLERAWTALQPLRDFRPAAVRHPDRDLLAGPVRGGIFAFPASLRAAALAAAALVVVAAGWWALRPAATSAPDAVYATTVGGYERVMLADGSVVELNGDTAAEVHFNGVERRVRLARGEAHFTVTKNPARPFRVEAGGVAVRAVGTAFNVRLASSSVEVLVTEGKVAVSDVGPALAAVPPRDERTPQTGAPTSGGPTVLSANERLVVGPARESAVERVSPAAMRDALAWQSPRLVFADTPLAEVVAQFNRRNAVQLELADADSVLASLPVGGSFRPENVEAFVRLLESGGDVTVDRADAARLVLRRTK